MCGRFTLTTDLDAVAKRFGVTIPPPDWGTCAPRYNIAPTQSVIVVGDDGHRSLSLMRWGLIPSWAKDPSIGNRLINARAETVAEKPAFRSLIKKRRCVIVADGFYEWQKTRAAKQPVRILMKNREPFGFAGLWDHWHSPDDGEIRTCAIITTKANDLLKEVHDRMPVILSQTAETLWLNPEIHEPAELLPLLKPYPSELMEYYHVSPFVNSPAHDTPECVLPLSTN